MKRKTVMKKLLPVFSLLSAAVMLWSAAMAAFAASTTDVKGKVEQRDDCTIEIEYSSDGHTFEGENIKLYHVADISENAEYSLHGVFADYSVKVTGTSSQTEWDEMTLTLNSYILADKITPDYEAATDADGKVKFENLSVGLYLVSSVRTESDGTYYVFESFMISLPGVDENSSWIYDVTAKPKMSEDKPSKGEVEYKVVKTWKDDGNNSRPTSVEVGIYKDGIIQGVTELNAENGWMYSWTTVDDGSVWTVTETEVPSGYKVGIQRNGDTFNVMNAYTGGGSPKTGDSSNIGFYLIIMALSGAAFVTFGLVRRKYAEADED